MPDNSPPNPGWKHQAAGPPKKEAGATPAWKKDAGAPAASAGPRAWQGQAGTSTEAPRGTSKFTKRLIAFGLLAALAGAAIYGVLKIRPVKPACLVLAGSSYDVNLAIPHNAYGWQGLKDVADAADRSSFVGSWFSGTTKVRLESAPVDMDESEKEKAWDRVWNDIHGNVREDTVVFFLALHGGADDKGPYFYLNDSRGQHRLYFADALEKIKTKWPGKNVVLVIEPALVAAHWTSGMLHNDFVKALKEKFDSELQKQKILVLCASSDDEISWPSEEWQQTIFTHYLLEGLAGAADRDGDLRVTALELFQYVRDKVATWSSAQRGTKQTPVLLPQDGGDKRAAGIELVRIEKPYAERGPAQAPGRTLSLDKEKELHKAWAEAVRLRDEQVPSPTAYTPQVWRLYRDTLLRWEQIERAGDPTGKASALKRKLADLKTLIERKARIDRPSPDLTWSLPLAGVLGQAPAWSSKDVARNKFEGLWQAPEKDRDEALQKLFSEDAEDRSRLLRGTELCRQLLHFLKDGKNPVAKSDLAAGDASGQEGKARAMVRLIENGLARLNLEWHRPAEVHFLVMLLNGLERETAPDLTLLQLALEVRLLAEECALAAPAYDKSYPHGEFVAAWIRPHVEAADASRRLGEDYLFGATEFEWNKARKLLTDAKKNYQDASEDAAVLREAVELRNRVLADLPDYTQWLARRPISASIAKQEKLTAQVERLSKNVARLAWCLEQTDFRGEEFRKPQIKAEGAVPRKLLEDLAAEIKKDFSDPPTGLIEIFNKTCDGLEQEDQPERWHELEAALAAPLVPHGANVSSRVVLLKRARGISGNLHDAAEGKFSKEQEKKDDAATAQNELLKQRLAVAALVPDKTGVLIDLKKADEVSSKIGSFWAQLPDKVAKDLGASLREPDLQKAAEHLRQAEFLSRLVPAGHVPSPDYAPFGPAEAMRHLRLHDLLLWQGQRTVADHWFDEKETYYVPTARAYAQMAGGVASAGAPKVAGRQDTAAQFRESVVKAGLTVLSPSDLDWTTEHEFPLTWNLTADKGVPAGVPMYWLRVDNRKAAADPESLRRHAAENWLAERNGKREEARAVTFRLKNPGGKDGKRENKAALVATFRGQEIVSAATPKGWTPDIIVNHFPPAAAGLAFRLDKDFDYGAISFVLDCSGSMSIMLGKKSRYEHAIEALEKVLEKIPDNTWVSLLFFIAPEKGRPACEVPLTLKEPKRWHQGLRAPLMRDLRALEARIRNTGGYSPIARAIVEARDLGFPSEELYPRGPKLIVALTDGDDNFSFGEFINPKSPRKGALDDHKERVIAYLRENFGKVGRGKDMEVHMVCFNEENDAESERAVSQFKNAVELRTPPGSYRTQAEPDKLAEELELAIRPRILVKSVDTPVPGLDGVPFNLYEGKRGTLKWRKDLKKGAYAAFIERGRDRQKAGTIELNLGDYMVLSLKRKDNGIILERNLLGEDQPPENGWRTSVLENQIQGNIVEQLVTVEASADDPRGRLRQVHPGFLWLELKAQDGRPMSFLNWHRVFSPSYPTPTVRLQSKPNPGVPKDLSLWWRPEGFTAKEDFAIAIDRKPALKLADNFVGPHIIGARKRPIRIESVEEERHEVAIDPDTREERACLVVRVSHPDKAPVFVLLQTKDKTMVGQEHRFFTTPGKYTAFFSGVTAADEFVLEIISLEDFKNSNETRKKAISLPAPN